MSLADIFLKQAEILERGWIKGASARKADGQTCPTTCDAATSFCFFGALTRAAYEEPGLSEYTGRTAKARDFLSKNAETLLKKYGLRNDVEGYPSNEHLFLRVKDHIADDVSEMTAIARAAAELAKQKEGGA